MIDPTAPARRPRAQRRRSAADELRAFETRVAALLEKEAHCPACQKAARAAEGTNEPRICSAHQRIRYDMAFSGMIR